MGRGNIISSSETIIDVIDKMLITEENWSNYVELEYQGNLTPNHWGIGQIRTLSVAVNKPHPRSNAKAIPGC